MIIAEGHEWQVRALLEAAEQTRVIARNGTETAYLQGAEAVLKLLLGDTPPQGSLMSEVIYRYNESV